MYNLYRTIDGFLAEPRRLRVAFCDVPLLNDKIFFWGPWVKVEKLEERLNAAGKSFLHIDYQNSDDPQAVMDQLTRAQVFPEIVFVKYLDEGHGPRPDTNSERLDMHFEIYFCESI